MSEELKRTYVPFQDFKQKSKQTEYTKETKLLDDKGNLLAKGWARRNVFTYEREKTNALRRKEWEFYQLCDGKYMALVSIVSIALGGYINVSLLDLMADKYLASSTIYFFGRKCSLPLKGDVPHVFKFETGGARFEINTMATSREIFFKKDDVECSFQMDLFENHENITTILPFENKPKRYFMTTKQNCMPTAGTFKYGENFYSFSKDNTFCVVDWGRIAAPRFVVWYWGNGACYIDGPDGKKHIFGFEITWGIGDESNATETCIFYDGKAHKIGAVDVVTFPKPDKYNEPWHVISEDGRFDMTMTPYCAHHTLTNIPPILKMDCNQSHGLWNGTVVLDDGTKLEIKDMYAFCEYVENKW